MPTCPVQGNADLYGLGIRIGLYIQMITVQLSGVLSASFRVEDHIGQGTIIFVASTVIILVRLINASISSATSADDDAALDAVEVFPVLTLLLVQTGVCRVSSRNRLAMLVWVAELVGLAALYNYFWWRGMDMLPRSCPDDKAFFFARVSIWGWYRSLNKAFGVFAAIGVAFTAVAYCGSAIYELVRWILYLVVRQNDDSSSGGGGGSDGNSVKQKPSPAIGSIDLLANVGAIVYVEVSLRWNNITGVHSIDSPGQFMPLVIALGQFLSVFYSAAKQLLVMNANEDFVGEEEDNAAECNHVRDDKTLPLVQAQHATI
ncbi:hypothetical protein GQ602_003196 [Ophiocordyceps camponoti-floridani]|uniref:Uncharacterized protein n=1 Tax=Ophiocordyceps camponoti-floridani TaxID=2030778 RepID=A0A8H4VE96_9HYPO|nr:hypothetical protein GQ602_003196 [Ophiocordyceps camponoti-floridani]